MRKRVGAVACGAAMWMIAGHLIHAQNPSAPPTFIPDIKFASGRSIVPYLEGWIKNPDESFDFVFGYLNRNTEQEPVIPPGPDNSVTPDGPDRGQPTYFLARRQPRIFRVRVPKDWGDKAITWSVTANGITEKVVSKLLPAEEITERMMLTGGTNNMVFGEEDRNQPPAITIQPIGDVAAGAPVSLTALVTDDGLPKPRPPAAPRPTEPANRFQSQRNSSTNRPAMVGLRVTWFEYRGPGKVTFDTNPIRVADGKAVTPARFSVPGSYTLIAMAGDGRLSTRKDVTITVK
jgi:hypothetical protein